MLQLHGPDAVHIRVEPGGAHPRLVVDLRIRYPWLTRVRCHEARRVLVPKRGPPPIVDPRATRLVRVIERCSGRTGSFLGAAPADPDVPARGTPSSPTLLARLLDDVWVMDAMLEPARHPELVVQVDGTELGGLPPAQRRIVAGIVAQRLGFRSADAREDPRPT